MVKSSSTLKARNSFLNSFLNEENTGTIGWYIQRKQFSIENTILKQFQRRKQLEQNIV